jgi:hypothetical protein
MSRPALQVSMRAACVALLTDYAAAATINLQVYPGRPRSLRPPTAFVDIIDETVDYIGQIVQRHPTAEMFVLHGLFDSKEAADQRDAFVDGFLDWAIDRYHAAGANTLVAVRTVQDAPNYVPDWLPPEEQRTYYATRISLEGLAATG